MKHNLFEHVEGNQFKLREAHPPLKEDREEGEYVGAYVPGTNKKYSFVSQGQIDQWRKDKERLIQKQGKISDIIKTTLKEKTQNMIKEVYFAYGDTSTLTVSYWKKEDHSEQDMDTCESAELGTKMLSNYFDPISKEQNKYNIIVKYKLVRLMPGTGMFERRMQDEGIWDKVKGAAKGAISGFKNANQSVQKPQQNSWRQGNIKCQHCGAFTDVNKPECQSCGFETGTNMNKQKCPHCGSQIKPGAKKCDACSMSIQPDVYKEGIWGDTMNQANRERENQSPNDPLQPDIKQGILRRLENTIEDFKRCNTIAEMAKVARCEYDEHRRSLILLAYSGETD